MPFKNEKIGRRDDYWPLCILGEMGNYRCGRELLLVGSPIGCLWSGLSLSVLLYFGVLILWDTRFPGFQVGSRSHRM